MIAASNYVRNHIEKDSNRMVVILGLSMGGAASIKAVAQDPTICDALIIDSSYADLWEVITNVFTKHASLPMFPFLPIMEILFTAFSGCRIRDMKPVEYVKEITQPLFFIHTCADTHTKPNDTVRLYAQAKNAVKKKLWMGPEAKHTRLHRTYAAKYRKKVLRFLQSIREKMIG